ncbi:hypothetical protein [Amycolatopsis orientalis]|uniref:hypothetical protein n=1 Tax=Amycolatopsis orientalis TaxID=31958 RepID=UPI0003A46C0A|nr:hypothetical protein [Amycolatopsis orientalis]
MSSPVATSVARSKLAQSTIQYPAMTASVSPNGPSVTTGALQPVGQHRSGEPLCLDQLSELGQRPGESSEQLGDLRTVPLGEPTSSDDPLRVGRPGSCIHR